MDLFQIIGVRPFFEIVYKRRLGVYRVSMNVTAEMDQVGLFIDLNSLS
jgi:hypothetical protein